MELIISLLVGALGGNIAGYLLKAKSLGTLWNSVVGILGGGLGYGVLGFLGLGGGGLIGGIIASLIGGAILLFVISLFRKAG